MNSKKILIIEDNPKVEAQLQELLSEFKLFSASNLAEVNASLEAERFDLIIIDHDLKAEAGLSLFRRIQHQIPQAKVIMLAANNDIPLAVTATKLGITDFFQKPVPPEAFRAAVVRYLTQTEEPASPRAAVPWLRGQSQTLKQFFADLAAAVATTSNLLLVGEPGIDKRAAVDYIHAQSNYPNKKIVAFDLLSFKNQEASFWMTIQEAMAEPAPGAHQAEEERCGTLFLNNFSRMEKGFQLSLISFFSDRKARLDKRVLVVIGCDQLQGVEPQKFATLILPVLRQRKDDLPQLLAEYLALAAVKYDRQIVGLTPELLSCLMDFDFPGNYLELENMIDQAVLSLSSGTIGLKELPLNIAALLNVVDNKCARQGRLALREAKQVMEKELLAILEKKNGGDKAQTARFLDLPQTVVTDRIAELGDDLSD